MKTKPISGLLGWANAHPIQTTLFTFLFLVAIPFTISANEKLAADPYVWAICGGVVFGLGGAWFMALWRHSKKLITLLLIAVIVVAPIQQIRAAMYGVGIVVLCVGSYCIYKVIKVCQNKLPPKSTNAPPEEFTAAGSEYGGACEYSSIGSCYTPPSLNVSPYENLLINPTTFTLNIMVETGGLTTSMTSNNEEGTTQTWAEFQAEMAEHGLFITGHPSPPQFSRNGVPCDAAQVPLEFDPATGRVTQRTGGDLRRVVIERSPNLVDWSPLLVTDVGVGSGFKVVDTTREGQMFYRIAVQ